MPAAWRWMGVGRGEGGAQYAPYRGLQFVMGGHGMLIAYGPAARQRGERGGRLVPYPLQLEQGGRGNGARTGLYHEKKEIGVEGNIQYVRKYGEVYETMRNNAKTCPNDAETVPKGQRMRWWFRPVPGERMYSHRSQQTAGNALKTYTQHISQVHRHPRPHQCVSAVPQIFGGGWVGKGRGGGVSVQLLPPLPACAARGGGL